MKRSSIVLASISLILLAVTGSSALAQSIQFDSSVSPELKSQVQDDFSFLESIVSEKASPLHQEIFGPVDGPTYRKWFEKRVFIFAVSVCGGAGSVACQDNQFPNQVFVTDHYINDGYPEVARLMTVFHEARHNEIENNHWPHKTCPGNFSERSIWTGASLRYKAACDNTEYGSYASAAVMLHNISKFCTNCSSKIKADAQLYSDDQIKRVTVSDPRARLDQDFAFE